MQLVGVSQVDTGASGSLKISTQNGFELVSKRFETSLSRASEIACMNLLLGAAGTRLLRRESVGVPMELSRMGT